jgi:hypothetical protein
MMPSTSTPIERRFVPTKRARIHVAIAGQGASLLLLHQTPRSQDEFRDALPLLGQRYRAIAMDTRSGCAAAISIAIAAPV